MNNEWHERLTRDGHLARCTSLIEKALGHDNWDLRCYLSGIFTYTDPSVLPLSPAQQRWRTCVRTIWKQASTRISSTSVLDLVIVTRQYLRGDNNISDDELTDLARDVHGALNFLQRIKFFMSVTVHSLWPSLTLHYPPCRPCMTICIG
ncbi:hypothetical protein BDR05DRAFT_545997 [Suillus weaverae]|nr:hypothetical protein BDR05DRAFT_545997 [Suillus weaverae]